MIKEINIARVILAGLIVLYHSFIIFSGGWAPPDGYVPNTAYAYIAKLSICFTLEAFVVISGYLFTYQSAKKSSLGESVSFGGLALKKAKRLLLPSIVFSALYLICFTQEDDLPSIFLAMINGAGHLWFLPMLFWCYVFGWFVFRVNLNDKAKTITLLLLSGLSVIPSIMGIGDALYYSFFFFSGNLLWKHRDKLAKYASKKHILIFWLVFVLCFALKIKAGHIVSGIEGSSQLIKYVKLIADTYLRLICASAGVFALYLTTTYLSRFKSADSSIIIKLAGLSFGTYIFQQFIIQFIYYHTSLADYLGFTLLPWVVFFVTLLASSAITFLFLKTKTGRFLIG